MTGVTRAAAVLAFCAGFAGGALAQARGELVEAIDIERKGAEALITIRFSAPIAYQTHTPVDSGSSLRIYPGIPGAETSSTRGMLRLPDTDMVPPFTVSYPEPDGALLIEFDRPTRFEVSPNTHAVTITVPVLPGARDWVVITKDWSLAPMDPKPKVLALLDAMDAVSEAKEVEQAEAEAQAADTLPEAVFQSTAFVTGFAGGGGGSYAVRVDSMKHVRFGTVVRQQQDWSCGSAAVATLLTYHYNHPLTESEALETMYARGNQAKIRREGFSLLDIKNYLESLGYQANGFETSLERLARVKVPAIVIINDSGYNHFVVVKGLKNGTVLLGDPAKGNRVLSRQTFEQMWENKIVFVITSRREGVAFNFSEDWRFMASPLGDALSRESLGSLLMTRMGPHDF
jgi:predicted double-glycine peptidase